MVQFSNTISYFFALVPYKRRAFINNNYFKVVEGQDSGGNTKPQPFVLLLLIIKMHMWVKFVCGSYSLPQEV